MDEDGGNYNADDITAYNILGGFGLVHLILKLNTCLAVIWPWS